MAACKCWTVSKWQVVKDVAIFRYLAAKVTYFGVGGDIRQFEKFLKTKKWKYETVFQTQEGEVSCYSVLPGALLTVHHLLYRCTPWSDKNNSNVIQRNWRRAVFQWPNALLNKLLKESRQCLYFHPAFSWSLGKSRRPKFFLVSSIKMQCLIKDTERPEMERSEVTIGPFR